MKKYAMIVVGLALVGCGKQGPAGPQGAQGPGGAVGSTGPQGQAGENGQDGQNGQDATQLSIVKLCPGTTVYPTTFVEVAFCVDGTLYGTYSDKGGFSTEFPPGRYNSTTIGTSCNFTVGDNCSISW